MQTDKQQVVGLLMDLGRGHQVPQAQRSCPRGLTPPSTPTKFGLQPRYLMTNLSAAA